jgi:hypothetical protein
MRISLLLVCATFLLAGCQSVPKDAAWGAATMRQLCRDSTDSSVLCALDLHSLTPVTHFTMKLHTCNGPVSPGDTLNLWSTCPYRAWLDSGLAKVAYGQLCDRVLQDSAAIVSRCVVGVGFVVYATPYIWKEKADYVVGALFASRDSVWAYHIRVGTKDSVAVHTATTSRFDSLLAIVSTPMYSYYTETDCGSTTYSIMKVCGWGRTQSVAHTSTGIPLRSDMAAGDSMYQEHRTNYVLDCFLQMTGLQLEF